MFQFPRFPLRLIGVPRLFIQAGFPIRTSPAKLARQLTEAYRSLATSFIGLQRQGIHRAPFVALTTTPLSTQHMSLLFGTGLIPQVINSIRLLTFAPAVRRTFRPQDPLRREGPWAAFPRRVLWWSRGDSNPRLPPCKGGALPTELRPHL